MEGKGEGSRRWRTVGVLAVGVALGASLFAAPASADFRESIRHIWKHIKPKADQRYANAVKGTDKARDADALDGKDSSEFLPAAVYTVSGNYTLGVPDPRTNGRKAELSCDPGDLLLSGDHYTGTVNNPNHYQGSVKRGDTWRLEWWVPGGGSGGYVALVVTCLDTALPAHAAGAARPLSQAVLD